MPCRLSLAAALSAALLAACGVDTAKEGSALMRPGENCLGCHQNFVAAGTVYEDAGNPATAGRPLAGVLVVLVDATNFPSYPMPSNTSGNFIAPRSDSYNNQFTFPIATVRLLSGTTSKFMPGGAPHGGCNAAGCHDASRRLVMPRP